jgi:tetratricopeptide (TPR) repeat protein
MLVSPVSRRALYLGLALLVPILGGWDWLTRPDADVAAGNRAFADGEYRRALAAYERSRAKHGLSPEIQLNIGAALHGLAAAEEDPELAGPLLDRAESAFREAAGSSDPEVVSSAYYNLGNALQRRDKLREAIEAYRQALRANQDNDNARYNLELALRRLQRESDPDRRADPDQGQGQPRDPGSEGQGQQPPSDPDQRPEGGEPPEEPDPFADPGAPDAGAPQPPPDAATPPSTGAPPSPSPPSGDGHPGAAGGDDRNRKLDALENRSRELRRRQLRRGAEGSGSSRRPDIEDW